MQIELSSSLFNKFIIELIGEKASFIPKDKSILPFFVLVDPQEQYWHVHEGEIWPIKSWKVHEASVKEKKRISDEYNTKIFKRKDALESLTKGIQNKLGLDEPTSRMMASKFLANKNPVELGIFFGVDLSDVPVLDKPHLVLDGNNSYIL